MIAKSKKTLATHFALPKSYYYMYFHSATFLVLCDQKPLCYLSNSLTQNRKVARWALFLYARTIEYIEGSKNCCADLLSRLHNGERNQGNNNKKSVR